MEHATYLWDTSEGEYESPYANPHDHLIPNALVTSPDIQVLIMKGKVGTNEKNNLHFKLEKSDKMNNKTRITPVSDLIQHSTSSVTLSIVGLGFNNSTH